ncbi:MAG: RagB/SusD family nutrient uptake outer membrane protein [Dysgonamonadaceae bacterium]|jgi:tetratricopeptide (TPR) repeat protein|nr:RagB/SusD family nutrient uptake outer membrane protein [Dysgonamonadaceae bacterium]
MKNKKSYYVSALLSLLLFSACNDYLDVIPDQRTEIDTEEKVALLLTGSYPAATYAGTVFSRVDNISDKGSGSADSYVTNRDGFFWRPTVQSEGTDSPTDLWTRAFHSIAGANGALEAIDNLGVDEIVRTRLNPSKGEALLLRSFDHFMLATMFCKFYDVDNPSENEKNMGLPYITEQELEVNKQYNRGTVKQLWDNIQKDLDEGLPLIGPDDTYTVHKYHFNRNAAYAFASRFYLYKCEFDKVIQYANEVIPRPAVIHDANVPSTDAAVIFVKNNFQPYTTTYIAGSHDDVSSAFTQTSNPSVLLVADTYAWLIYWLPAYYFRYGLSIPDITNTIRSSNNPLGVDFGYRYINYSATSLCFPDKFNSLSSSNRIPFTFFRLEELLLNRAEAYARTDRFDEAIADLNLFFRTRARSYDEKKHVLTLQNITDYYRPSAQNADFYMNKYNAFGSKSWSDEKKSLIHLILVCRQNEFLGEGLRYWDMVRYKMECTHTRSDGQSNTLYPGDDRWVFQLPTTAPLSGLEMNPVTNLLSPEW